MTWVPHLRYLAHHGNEIVPVVQPDHQQLYADFAPNVEYWMFAEGVGDCWNFSEKPRIKPFMPAHLREKYPDHEVYLPNKQRCLYGEREYRRYSSPLVSGVVYDLLIHARKVRKYGSEGRNWPLQSWMDLVKQLRNKSVDMNIGSIGSRHGAYWIPGTADLREEPFNVLCDTMAKARLLIGPSSGPMHLGELTGTPRVVWTGREPHKILDGHTNKWRYETWWHPFSTPVKVIETWQPSVDRIYKAVVKRICA